MEYADREQLDDEMRKVFLEVIRELDARWGEWQRQNRR